MRKFEFIDCKFKSCNLIKSNFSRGEFDKHLFIDCQFYRVNLGSSYWLDCIFRKTRSEEVNFEGAILSNLKIKDLITLNSNSTETSPTIFYKSKSDEFINVKSQTDFEKILKDLNLIISNDEDDMENSEYHT